MRGGDVADLRDGENKIAIPARATTRADEQNRID
jgi:hypothetical protein